VLVADNAIQIRRLRQDLAKQMRRCESVEKLPSGSVIEVATRYQDPNTWNGKLRMITMDLWRSNTNKVADLQVWNRHLIPIYRTRSQNRLIALRYVGDISRIPSYGRRPMTVWTAPGVGRQSVRFWRPPHLRKGLYVQKNQCTFSVENDQLNLHLTS
jgi:hypothetical protein